jgi:aminopeptidase
LKRIINFDKRSCYLGEVALVPCDSPIALSNTLFYQTIFDENASCHLALGNSYPTTILNGVKMDTKTLDKNGGNSSLAHVDFMFGTKDLEVFGYTKTKKIQIFKTGKFCI